MSGPHDAPSTSPAPRPGLALARGALAGVALAALAVVVLRRPGWILEALDAARDAGVVGRVLFGGVYLVAALLMLPASPITVCAGHAFGVVIGVLVAAPATCLAACAPFFLSRTLLRGPVSRRLARLRGFPLLASALRRRGLGLIALLRLSPLVPFPVLNYVVGLTPVRLRDFAAGSFLGMLPGTLVYAWLGSLVPDPRQEMRTESTASWAVLAGLLAMTAGVAVLARRALLRALAEAGASPDPP